VEQHTRLVVSKEEDNVGPPAGGPGLGRVGGLHVSGVLAAALTTSAPTQKSPFLKHLKYLQVVCYMGWLRYPRLSSGATKGRSYEKGSRSPKIFIFRMSINTITYI
jgi:hypothetical protein